MISFPVDQRMQSGSSLILGAWRGLPPSSLLCVHVPRTGRIKIHGLKCKVIQNGGTSCSAIVLNPTVRAGPNRQNPICAARPSVHRGQPYSVWHTQPYTCIHLCPARRSYTASNQLDQTYGYFNVFAAKSLAWGEYVALC